LCFL